MEPYEKIEAGIVPADARSGDSGFVLYKRLQRQADGTYREVASWRHGLHKQSFATPKKEPQR